MTTRTARQPRTTVRTPRAAPPGRGAIPSAAVRRRRGPRPPDGVILALHEAIRAELADAGIHTDAAASGTPRLTLGERWRRALRRALGAIALLARRGVLAALRPGAANEAARRAPAAPESGAEDPTSTVESSIAGGVSRGADGAAILSAAAGVAGAWVLREHARQVEHLARAAGADRYAWTTEHDERVRELHRELEGTVHRFDDPPISGTDGFRGNPGEPAACRCVAWPVTPT